MGYEECREVSGELWEDLARLDPEAVAARTGVRFEAGAYRLPFLGRTLMVAVGARQIHLLEAPETDPGHRVCLMALLYLPAFDPRVAGGPVSPLELPGGPTFFRGPGPHALPTAALEARFGEDAPALVTSGQRLAGVARPLGDAAVALEVFPNLVVEVILWQGDEEFPAQVSFTVPARLDRFWHLDAVLALLQLAEQELLRAGAGAAA